MYYVIFKRPLASVFLICLFEQLVETGLKRSRKSQLLHCFVCSWFVKKNQLIKISILWISLKAIHYKEPAQKSIVYQSV